MSLRRSARYRTQWYDEFVETGDIGVLQRILDYNEDDCRAKIVLLDALRSMR